MLHWIIWNRTVLSSNVGKQKNVPILNWIVWNRIAYMYKNGFGIK